MLKSFCSYVLLLSITPLSFAQAPKTPKLPSQLENKVDNITAEITASSSLLVSPFHAKYSVLRKSKVIGTGNRKLERLTDSTYQYSYNTDLEWFIFSDKREEKSLIKIVDNKIIPTHYKFFREGTGRDKFYEWRFDIPNNKAVNIKENKEVTINYPENVQDSLSYHLQHRFNLIQNPENKTFNYSVVKSSGSIREYEYQFDGEEEIMLPYGLVKTIKLKREVKEKERVTYAWFAPELNYLLVRLYQIKEGTEQFEAQLISVEELH